MADLSAFGHQYLAGGFDLAVVPRWDVDFNGALRLAWGSGAPTVGFSEHCTPRKAILNRGDDRFYTKTVLDHRRVHEVEHDFLLIQALGGEVATRSASVDLTASDVAAAERFIGQAFGGRRKPVLAVAPLAEAGRKRLPLPRIAAVVRRLAQHADLDVAVIASPHEAPEAEAFAEMVGSDAISAAGRLTLRESAALIGRAALFIGLDSGPAHIAGALGTPVAVLFPNAADAPPNHVGSPARFRPWAEPSRMLVLQPERALPPCIGGCEATEPHCILQLSEEVLWPRLRDFAGPFVTRR